MNQAQYYTDFVEGRLDEDSLKEFTNLLAIDREFLSGFQNFLVITQTISSYTSKIKAPDDFTEGLFEKLGFSLHPDSDEEILSKQQPKKNFSGGNFFKGMFSGVVFSAIILAFIYFLFNSGNHTVNSHFAIPGPVAKLFDKDKVDNSIENQGVVINKKSGHNALENTSGQLASREPYPVEDLRPVNLNPDNSTAVLNSKNPTAWFANLKETNPGPDVSELTRVNSSVNTSTQLGNSDISIEFNNSAVWNLPQPHLRYRELSPINNLCLSIFYHFDERIKAGFEVRQESYFMDYYGTEPDSIMYKYTQHSNFLTFGARAAYQPLEFFNIWPTLQFGLGFNSGGYALRPGLGFEYRAYPNLSFYLGAEYTRFWFIHQSSWNNTSKIGLNYGLAYTF